MGRGGAWHETLANVLVPRCWRMPFSSFQAMILTILYLELMKGIGQYIERRAKDIGRYLDTFSRSRSDCILLLFASWRCACNLITIPINMLHYFQRGRVLGDKCGDVAQLNGDWVFACSLCIDDAAKCVSFIAFVAGLAFSTLAVAAGTPEGRSAGALPPTKIQFKKQDSSCDTPDISNNQSAAQQELRNRSCLVSLSAIDKLRTQKNFSFVDVRSPTEYDSYRIAGSINIPLHLIKTKEFLKKMPVVLVNDGRTTLELEKFCGELRLAGFEHLAVLDGGLFAWHTNKRALEGDPVELSRLNRMSAEELFEARASTKWSVIDVSTQRKDKEIRSWLPAKVIAVPFRPKLERDSVVRISSVILQQRKKSPQSKLLLIADNNDIYERIDARLKKSDVTSGVLRLDGGMNGYREHVAKQVAIWSHQNELSKPRRYAACPG